MKPARLEISIDMEKVSGGLVPDPFAAARVIHAFAFRMVREGLTPGGMWGGQIVDWNKKEVGYWVLHPEGEGE